MPPTLPLPMLMTISKQQSTRTGPWKLQQQTVQRIVACRQAQAALNQELMARQQAQAAMMASSSCSSPMMFHQDYKNIHSIPNGGVGQQLLLATMAQTRIPIAAAAHQFSPQDSYPSHHHQGHRSSSSNNNINKASLKIRVLELEGQLAKEQLQSRIDQLEHDLSSQRSMQGQMRSVLDVGRGDEPSSTMSMASGGVSTVVSRVGGGVDAGGADGNWFGGGDLGDD